MPASRLDGLPAACKFLINVLDVAKSPDIDTYQALPASITILPDRVRAALTAIDTWMFINETHTWIAKFGMLPLRKQCWRTVKSFTFPQACNASKIAVNLQSLAHSTDVRGIARQSRTPKASDKGDQSSPEAVQSDQDDQWMNPEKVEFREVKNNKPKRGTKEGIVASKKKAKREKNVATTAKKQKVTKAKKVR